MSRAFASLGGTPGTPDVGTSWDSPAGRRTIVGTATVAGAPRFTVETEGERLPELIRPEDIQREIDRDERNAASRRAARTQTAAAAAAQKSARARLEAFGACYSALAGGKKIAALEVQASWARDVDYRHKLIERRVAAGWRVTTMPSGVRRFSAPDETFFDEKVVTKTGMDYAEFLVTGSCP